MLELAIGICLSLALLAFIAEYVDSTLGMGYGTTLTPILMAMGFEPMQIVPAVLVSELFTGFLAGFTHHTMGNVDFVPRTMRVTQMFKHIKENGLPLATKATLLIAACSVIGTVASVCLAVSLPKFYVKLYIAILILLIGIVILGTMKMTFKFSWLRMIGLGLLASFNKGISGGGYGPVVTGGQVLSGVDGKNAIGITSLAEGITCLVGLIMYFILGTKVDWKLAGILSIGAILSVPLAGISIKKLSSNKLRIMIGITTIILGGYTFYKIFA